MMWCRVRILKSHLMGLFDCLNVEFTACVDISKDTGDFPVVGVKGSDLRKLISVKKDYFEGDTLYYFKSDDVKLIGVKL